MAGGYPAKLQFQKYGYPRQVALPLREYYGHNLVV